MKARIYPSRLAGEVEIPGSKSHTIRAVAVGALAGGRSTIRRPLVSADTLSAVRAYSAAGARVERSKDLWTVEGTLGEVRAPEEPVDVANSGTTLRLALGAFSLLREGTARLTGDEQIRRRPAGPLARSLEDLGASVKSLGGNDCAPFEVSGRLRGGRTSIEAVTSQYLSSLLLAAPLADGDSLVDVPVLNEAPYVHMTLDWLRRAGVELAHAEGLSHFEVPGGQAFAPFERTIPADFSSATFFLGAGAIGENDVRLLGLKDDPTQGDRAVLDYLRELGARVSVEAAGTAVSPGGLCGAELDLNATPDALPMMAVLGCFARGRTLLGNVPQARIKESDRIEVMAAELSKMGASVEELEDGLVVEESALRGARLDGRGDHRVVMALSVAATAAEGESEIEGAEAVEITFPGFFDLLGKLTARIELEE